MAHLLVIKAGKCKKRHYYIKQHLSSCTDYKRHTLYHLKHIHNEKKDKYQTLKDSNIQELRYSKYLSQVSMSNLLFFCSLSWLDYWQNGGGLGGGGGAGGGVGLTWAICLPCSKEDPSCLISIIHKECSGGRGGGFTCPLITPRLSVHRGDRRRRKTIKCLTLPPSPHTFFFLPCWSYYQELSNYFFVFKEIKTFVIIAH